MSETKTLRVSRMLDSLAGLSVGDAFGETFFLPPGLAESMIVARRVPPPKWRYTDDTVMALSVVDILLARETIDQDELAKAFAERHREEPTRGYGGGAREILKEIERGAGWRQAGTIPFGSAGSFGNGAAMRVAPLGAYFADDLERLVWEARASAEVTHLHPEGIAGAIAIALAAAYAWLVRAQSESLGAESLLEFVHARLARFPALEVLRGVEAAMSLPPSESPERAAEVLGSGYQVSAQDTVPFCLWSASRHLSDYEEAMWQTVAGLGDRDTTCAIVGGIVATRTGSKSIPERWLLSREGLSLKYKPLTG